MKNLKLMTHDQLVSEIHNFVQLNSPLKKDLVNKAYWLAWEVTKDQKVRPDGPYINHILRVATGCIYFGVSTIDIIIGALLHDSVEDHPEKLSAKLLSRLPENTEEQIRQNALQYIEQEFGAKVRVYVALLTNPIDSHIYDEDMQRQMYVRHVEDLLKTTSNARIIKLADFYDNGVDLYTIDDEIKRKNLCKRYAPIYKLFIEAIPLFPKTLLRQGLAFEIIQNLKKSSIFANYDSVTL